MRANVTRETRRRGFTLLELVLVMMLLGILAVFVLPRFASSSLGGGVFRDQVASALRHAQKTATSHRRLVCANIGTNALNLSMATSPGSTSCNHALQLADGSATLQGKDADAHIAPAPMTLYFRPDGRVSLNAGGASSDNVVLSVGGLQVAIVGETGHVR